METACKVCGGRHSNGACTEFSKRNPFAPLEATTDSAEDSLFSGNVKDNGSYAHVTSPANDYGILNREDEFKKHDLLKKDPAYTRIFEDEALQFLLTVDRAWFDKNYNGQRTRAGYLLDKEGKETDFLPSQCITAGLDRVIQQALNRYYAKKGKTSEATK